jgi:hypothetical protein
MTVIILYVVDPQCFCCTTLRDVKSVERCSIGLISTTFILQYVVVCWVTEVTALKDPIVVEALPFSGKARGDYGEPFVALGELFLHTAPTESSILIGVNFGIHRRLRVPRLFLYPSSLLMHFTL